jgi:acyl dehydratase
MQGIEGVKSYAGQHIGKSGWKLITQDMIDKFADAGQDWNWVHIDPDRAASSPFGGTIAHGFLSVALLIPLKREIFLQEGFGMGLNYGFDRVRFPSAVPVDSHIRLAIDLTSVDEVGDGLQLTMDCVLECDASEKPAMVARWIMRQYPSPDSRLR